MKNQKADWEYLLIVLFLSLAVGAGILGYWHQIKKEDIKPPDFFGNSEEKNKKSRQGALDVHNWKLYRNEEFGFEFFYPPKWDIEEDKEKNSSFYIYHNLSCDSCGQSENLKIKFDIEENNFLLSLSDWADRAIETGIEGITEPFIVDGSIGIKRVFYDSGEYPFVILVLFPEKNNPEKLYCFLTSGLDNEIILDEILANFRFLN